MVRASLGKDGGDFHKSTTVTVGTKETYPMYVLPISELLQLTEWVPHQDLLAAGKLVKLSEIADASQVIFLSHQWCSFLHPDPKANQLKALQKLQPTLPSHPPWQFPQHPKIL